ncbi:MAG: SIMPL domain-containing protein [Janthinobacterium lividum]
MRSIYAGAALAALLSLSQASAFAQSDNPAGGPPPSGVLSLSADATAEVPSDRIRITVFHEESAADPATLTAALTRATQHALTAARGQAGVDVSTGGFNVYASNDRDGHVSEWRGRSELVLDSADFAAASKLAGALGPEMQVGSVNFSLSSGARRAAEAKLASEAIDNFRQQAQHAVGDFGYRHYSIRSVQVGNESAVPRPIPMAMFARNSLAKSDAIPVEASKTTVTVTVSGSVQMAN